MKNSLLFFLPSDEYKRNKIKGFFSEALLLVIIVNFFLLISIQFYNKDFINNEFFAFINIVIPAGYILIRYILSGIEYTAIFTSTDYSKENKRLVKNSFKFFVMFALLTLIFKGIPTDLKETTEILGVALIAAIILMIINWLSLKLSYKKNRNLG
ncbi:hypothetical protein [Solibacillus isronensis]|uniref:hypothetical protein n=1 Tax=Solibacillus isronensis TaxID=412383 RepID=UPI00203FEE13|nr:hypothetical protein [Solibacillus isronensis]MCM3722926.1 hypothetical protein [Solibacillus isronensis]